MKNLQFDIIKPMVEAPTQNLLKKLARTFSERNRPLDPDVLIRKGVEAVKKEAFDYERRLDHTRISIDRNTNSGKFTFDSQKAHADALTLTHEDQNIRRLMYRHIHRVQNEPTLPVEKKGYVARLLTVRGIESIMYYGLTKNAEVANHTSLVAAGLLRIAIVETKEKDGIIVDPEWSHQTRRMILNPNIDPVRETIYEYTTELIERLESFIDSPPVTN